MRIRVLFAVLALWLGVSSVPPSAAAQADPSALTVVVQAGFDGAYRTGEWFPVVVEIANSGPDAQVTLEWSFPGQRGDPIFERRVDLPRGAQKRVTLDVFSRSFARNGLLQVQNEGTLLLERAVPLEALDADRFVIGTLSNDPALLASLNSLSGPTGVGVSVRPLRADGLPEHAAALRAVNMIFLHDRPTPLTPQQTALLKSWVQLGGQLVVSGGANAAQNSSGLEDILPVEPGGTISTGSLDVFASAALPMPAEALNVAINEVQARPGAANPQGFPLILAWNVGEGQVLFAPFDIAALRGWSGESNLWRQVLRFEQPFVPGLDARVTQFSLLQRVYDLPELRLPAPATLFAFLLIYLLVIGPMNFLILNRLRRLEWAWVSIPATVLIFSAGLYLVGFGLRGNQPQISQIAIVQATEQEARGLATGSLGLFSPQRATYTLGFPGMTLLSKIGSLDGISIGRSNRVVADDTSVSLPDIVVDVAAFEMLVAEEMINLPIVAQSSLRVENGVLRGELRNNGSAALEDAVLVRGTEYVQLGRLAPGAALNVDLSTGRRGFPRGVQLANTGQFNRDETLAALFSGGGPISGLGGRLDPNGIYLIGWLNQPAIAVNLNGLPANQEAISLYIIRLRG